MNKYSERMARTREVEDRLIAYYYSGANDSVLRYILSRLSERVRRMIEARLRDGVSKNRIPGFSPSLYSRAMKRIDTELLELTAPPEQPTVVNYPDPTGMKYNSESIASMSIPCVAFRTRKPDYFIVDLYTCNPQATDAEVLHDMVIAWRVDRVMYARPGRVIRVSHGTDICGADAIPIFDKAPWVLRAERSAS